MGAPLPLGIVTGGGRMPRLAARLLRDAGRSLFVIQLAEAADARLGSLAEQVEVASIGQAGKTVAFFKENGIAEVLLIGKVNKTIDVSDIQLDALGLEMLQRLPGRADASIFGVVADEFHHQGITVVRQTDLLGAWLAPEGSLAGPPLTAAVAADVDRGFLVAKTGAGFDIGQTVVVRQKSVVAIEAYEHTNACLRRAGKLARNGLTVCKVARPRQDLRFDVPVIGPDTLKIMNRIGGKCLAVEAGMTLWVEQDKSRRLAEEFGISLVGVARGEAPA